MLDGKWSAHGAHIGVKYDKAKANIVMYSTWMCIGTKHFRMMEKNETNNRNNRKL